MSLEFRTLQPEEFYRQHIEAGVRPDGRQLGERRAMAVSAGNISTADGSAIVRQGGTTVVCGVRAELAPPRPEEPDRGYLVSQILTYRVNILCFSFASLTSSHKINAHCTV